MQSKSGSRAYPCPNWGNAVAQRRAAGQGAGEPPVKVTLATQDKLRTSDNGCDPAFRAHPDGPTSPMYASERSPYSSLPGTQQPPRGLFLDRWGTLFQIQEGPCSRFEDLEITPGALELLFRTQQEGWNLYLLGNEDHVAQGRVSDADWKELQASTHAHLSSYGIEVKRDYTCVDDPLDGCAGHRADSVYRLPITGAFYHAVHNDSIDLSASWVVGDSTLELVAGWRAGCHTLGLESGLALSDATFHVEPDLMASDLSSGLLELLSLVRGVTR